MLKKRVLWADKTDRSEFKPGLMPSEISIHHVLRMMEAIICRPFLELNKISRGFQMLIKIHWSFGRYMNLNFIKRSCVHTCIFENPGSKFFNPFVQQKLIEIETKI